MSIERQVLGDKIEHGSCFVHGTGQNKMPDYDAALGNAVSVKPERTALAVHFEHSL